MRLFLCYHIHIARSLISTDACMVVSLHNCIAIAFGIYGQRMIYLYIIMCWMYLVDYEQLYIVITTVLGIQKYNYALTHGHFI